MPAIGYVNALEGTKGGPVREFGKAPSLEDYMKLEGEFEKRAFDFIRKNAAANKPFYVAWWPALGGFIPSPKKNTANGGVLAELLAPLDVRVGALMEELKTLDIAENTLVVLMADNGPMVHNGPPALPPPPSDAPRTPHHRTTEAEMRAIACRREREAGRPGAG